MLPTHIQAAHWMVRQKQSEMLSVMHLGPSHRGIKLNTNFCVQETPLKKQVPNYQQFKLQRAR